MSQFDQFPPANGNWHEDHDISQLKDRIAQTERRLKEMRQELERLIREKSEHQDGEPPNENSGRMTIEEAIRVYHVDASHGALLASMSYEQVNKQSDVWIETAILSLWKDYTTYKQSLENLGGRGKPEIKQALGLIIERIKENYTLYQSVAVAKNITVEDHVKDGAAIPIKGFATFHTADQSTLWHTMNRLADAVAALQARG